MRLGKYTLECREFGQAEGAHKLCASERHSQKTTETLAFRVERVSALIRQLKAVEYPLAVLEDQFAEEILVKAMLLLYFLVRKVAKLILG